MTPEKRREALIATGEALYGSRWQTALADDLKTTYRTVRRWVAGQDIPWGVEAELRGLLMARGVAINAVLASME